MAKLVLKDGKIIEVADGTSAAEAIKEIGMGLYKSACCVKINGVVCDLRTAVNGEASFEVCTFDSKDGREVFWHTASHLLAMAVMNLFPNAKLARGPATDDGFYYDFGMEIPINTADLVKIENEMRLIVKSGVELVRQELSQEQAVDCMKDQPFKLELIDKHAGETLSVYRQGDFVDLCAGPHLLNVSPLKAVKLLSCTGAYWGKAEDGRQLSRVYGVAYPKAAQLDEHLKRLEEAKLRDHNKIGRELEYFTTVDTIGQGLPVLLPKGARVVQVLQRFVEDEEQRRGYLLTKTPLMAKSDLYKLSGHWDHYRDGMFVMGEEEKNNAYALRPMTCPFQYQVFLNRQRSYRDLPMRLGETSTLFRNEDSGEMHGLIRVRQFTISEGHIICTREQLAQEFKNCVELSTYMLGELGLLEDVTYRFSQWDPDDADKYVGTPEQWHESQQMMKEILDEIGIEYEVAIGEAAFYGPKLDLQCKNVFGKEDTIVTVQIDEILAENFGMEYISKDATKLRPAIIHRTNIGCYERTLALLLEKYAGALPTWLAPEQCRILPISDRSAEYALEILSELEKYGVRATIDSRNEKLGYKLREAQLQKIPNIFVIGDNEVDNNSISMRSRPLGDLGVMDKNLAVQNVVTQITTRMNPLKVTNKS